MFQITTVIQLFLRETYQLVHATRRVVHAERETCDNFFVVAQLILANMGLWQQPENWLACPFCTQLWSSFLWLRHFEYQRTQAPRERYEWRPRGPRGAGRQLQEIQELSHPYMLIVTGFWHGWYSPSLFRYSRCLKFALKTHTPAIPPYLSSSISLSLSPAHLGSSLRRRIGFPGRKELSCS